MSIIFLYKVIGVFSLWCWPSKQILEAGNELKCISFE